MEVTLIIAIITIIGNIVLALIQYKKPKSELFKATSEGVNVLVDGTIKLIKPYQDELEELHRRNKEKDIIIANLEAELEELKRGK